MRRLYAHITEATSAYQRGDQRIYDGTFEPLSHFDTPEEWPPVDLMQSTVIDICGQTVPPVFLVVCDQVFGAGHLNENEHGIYTGFWKALTTPVL